MAKQSGLGDNLYVSQFDLSGDVGALGRIGGGFAALDVTAINKSAHERIAGIRDGGIDFTAYFNDAAAAAHVALSSLPTADRIVSYFRGTALGSPAASCVAKQINYDPTRGNDGALELAISTQANAFGLEWGTQHTAGKRTDGSATSPASGVDGGAETEYGLQAYLHVFSVASGTPSFKLQESSDAAGSGDAFADVTDGAFTITAAGSERIATANTQTIERYLRVVTTGTFTDAVFAVVVVRNLVAGVVF